MDAHGGRLAVEVLQRHGVDTMFTLSGGICSCSTTARCRPGLRLVDVRHEQTATFAAEGWAKVTRRLGCAALTAGPGVTNGVSAIDRGADERLAARRARAAARRRRVGVRVRCRSSTTSRSSLRSRSRPRPRRRPRRSSPKSMPRAAPRGTPHRGPAFVDIPLDAFGPGVGRAARRRPAPSFRGAAPDPGRGRARRGLGRRVGASGADRRRRRVLGARGRTDACVRGGRAYPGLRERDGARNAARRSRARVLAGTVGRAASKPISCSWRARRSTSGSASAGSAMRGSCICCDATTEVAAHARLAASTAGDLAATFASLAEAGAPPDVHDDWIDSAPRRRAVRSAPPKRASLDADTDRRSSRRVSTASCRSVSTATRS